MTNAIREFAEALDALPQEAKDEMRRLDHKEALAIIRKNLKEPLTPTKLKKVIQNARYLYDEAIRDGR